MIIFQNNSWCQSFRKFSSTTRSKIKMNFINYTFKNEIKFHQLHVRKYFYFIFERVVDEIHFYFRTSSWWNSFHFRSLGDDFFRTCTLWFLEREVDVNIYQSFRTHTCCQSFRIFTWHLSFRSIVNVNLLNGSSQLFPRKNHLFVCTYQIQVN